MAKIAVKQIASPADIKRLGKIVSVWAHPDDESYLAAGILAQAVENGQPVACITATKGEAGIQDETRWPAKELPNIRAHELAAALHILGVKEHYWLGYKDGCCAECSFAEAVNKLADILAKEQPDTILTFGPDGWTGHPDHSSVSKWVSAAAVKLDKKPSVFHVVHTPEHFEKYFRKADDLLNIFYNIDKPPLLPAAQCDIYFKLPKSIRDKKNRALAAMPSQTAVVFERLDPQLLAGAWASECFVRA